VKRSVFREYFESLVIAVIMALFVRTFVFQAFKIPSGSMEPNLLEGDHLIVNKMEFAPAASALERAILPGRPIQRGDIVVFKFPKDPERDFIKRVIGLPGERLELRQKRIYINDQPLEEPYAHVRPVEPGSAPGADLRVNYGPVTVPNGQYFMMGDNRDYSEDSRFWGFLPAGYVKGQALFIYFSFVNAASTPTPRPPDQGEFAGVRWRRILNVVR
jgi:signal peptidase I